VGGKGRELVDYAASLRLDTLFITDLPGSARMEVGARVSCVGMPPTRGSKSSLAPGASARTSKVFKNDWGTAEEHLALGLKLAKAVGSDIFRAVLGTREDRKTPGGIEARIADTVTVLKSKRSLAVDSASRCPSRTTPVT